MGLLSNLCVLMLISMTALAASRRPVIFMHGIFNNPKEPNFASDYIPKKLNGTKVYVLDVYNHIASFVNINDQLRTIIPAMRQIMRSHADTGVDLLCYSQGGFICRAAVQMMSDHNVHTFVALSSPLVGQYGLTDEITRYLEFKDRKYVWEFAYTGAGQDISFCNYWNDPHHQKEFTDPELSVLVAVLNNQTRNTNSNQYKANFMKIKTLVTISGPDDGVITPWQSAHFGFYDQNENIIDMKKQKWFINDDFGLKTLEKRGSIYSFTISGVDHKFWYRNQTVYDCCIIPFL